MDENSQLSRRQFLGASALTAFFLATGCSTTNKTRPEKPQPLPHPPTANVKPPSSIRLEASRWSDLPELLQKYEAILDRETDDGTSRIFGYASIIKNHKNEKPEGSKGIPNERAQLPGMEVAMNVYAAGEVEFRGTRGKYTDALGKEKRFASVGLYAGLEPALAPDGFADGLAVTASKEDRRASLLAYIERELGKPPKGIDLKTDLFDPNASAKFSALKGTPEDEFGMYKFQVAEIKIGDNKKVPAVTVSTNEKSKFAAIGLAPMQAAALILDGQGYKRKMGDSTAGGSALDYFKQSVIGTAREFKLNQRRLDEIDAAVEELAIVYSTAADIIEQKLPPAKEYEAFKKLIDEHPSIAGEKGIFSPYFYDGQNVNKRDPVGEEDKKRPENLDMPRTAGDKLLRIRDLKKEGKTSRTR